MEYVVKKEIDFKEPLIITGFPSVGLVGNIAAHQIIKELNLDFFSDEEIDIDQLITEQILLAVPMKPLCNSKCPGICPVCGKNLNEGKCNCKTDKVDPRLLPLERLKKKMEERKE